MTRFTRIDSKQGGVTRPPAGGNASSRLYGDTVNMGEPLTLQGDLELRKQVETSLEAVAKERLLEAERQAEAKIAEGMAAAERLLADAEAQAQQMIETAQAQVNQIREEAHESGFKAGFQEGYGDATEQVETETIELLQGAQLLVEGAYAAEKRVLKDFKNHAVQLIGHIVQRILRRELTESPETLLAMVEQAVDSLYLSGKVRIVVSGQVIQELRGFSQKTENMLESGMQRFEWVADPALEAHQIYVISQEGRFDVSPATQARHLLSAIEANLELPSDSPNVSSDSDMPGDGLAEISTAAAGHCEEQSDVAISEIEDLSAGEDCHGPDGPRNDGSETTEVGLTGLAPDETPAQPDIQPFDFNDFSAGKPDDAGQS